MSGLRKPRIPAAMDPIHTPPEQTQTRRSVLKRPF